MELRVAMEKDLDAEMTARFEQAGRNADELIAHLNDLARQAGERSVPQARKDGKI